MVLWVNQMKIETDTIANISAKCDICDNVCRGLQNWQYCFYRWCHNVFYVRLVDKLAHAVTNWPNIFWIMVSSVIQAYQWHAWKGKCPIFTDKAVDSATLSTHAFDVWRHYMYNRAILLVLIWKMEDGRTTVDSYILILCPHC